MATQKQVEEPKEKNDQQVKSANEISTSLEIQDLRTMPEHRQIEAFKLLTDAQAQRRNLSNKVMYTNRTFISSFLLLAAFIIYKIRQRSTENGLMMEWGSLLLSLAGLAMGMFSLASKYTEETVNKAERMDIDEIFGVDKDVFAFVYNNIVVGVVAVRRTPTDPEGKLLLEKAEEALAKKCEAMDEFQLKRYKAMKNDKIKILHTVPDNAALIAGWAVLKKYRGIGMGKDLLKKAEEIAFEKFHAERLIVVTESIEVPANKLLTKNGYKTIQSAKCKGYRGSWFNIRELVWSKTLVSPTK